MLLRVLVARAHAFSFFQLHYMLQVKLQRVTASLGVIFVVFQFCFA